MSSLGAHENDSTPVVEKMQVSDSRNSAASTWKYCGEIRIPNFHSFKWNEFCFWPPSWDPIIWPRDKLPVLISKVGRDSSVGIATRYGLDGPVIESRWGGGGARFSAPVQTGPGAHSVSYTTGTGSLPGVKMSGYGVNHPLPSSAEVKGRVELYLYFSLRAFVARSRVDFAFTDFRIQAQSDIGLKREFL